LFSNKTTEEAVEIMLNIHQKGIGICGVYTYEVSETKVNTVHSLAREHGFPLKVYHGGRIDHDQVKNSAKRSDLR